MRVIRELILSQTRPCRQHSLTPELSLRLLTPASPLWTGRPEESPFEQDPFWAIYWPGGQALSRYLLDHSAGLCKGKRVLDLGSGCGASALAAIAAGAAHAEANDVDEAAAVAAELNAEKNLSDSCRKRLTLSTTNYLKGDSQNLAERFDVLLLGDMYFDPDLSGAVDRLSEAFLGEGDKVVFVGDPGRWLLGDSEKQRLRGLRAVAKYELPEEVKRENSGLGGCGFVFRKLV